MRRLLPMLAIPFALALGPLAALGSTPAAAMKAAPLPAGTPWGQGEDASPAFTPDGRTVVFARGRGSARRLFVSHRRGDTWSAPRLAPFSGTWMDIEPAMAPDGSYLVFASNRPMSAGGSALDGHYEGASRPQRGANLWRVNRIGNGWSTPVRLPATINSSNSVYAPTLAADGSLYFMKPDPQTDHFRLYVARFAHGAYATPEPLPFSDGAISDMDPAVAPDRSFLVFTSGRTPAPTDQDDLFVVLATPSGWSAPMHLPLSGYDSRLDPDAGRVYFTASDHRIRSAPLAAWLARHGVASH